MVVGDYPLLLTSISYSPVEHGQQVVNHDPDHDPPHFLNHSIEDCCCLLFVTPTIPQLTMIGDHMYYLLAIPRVTFGYSHTIPLSEHCACWSPLVSIMIVGYSPIQHPWIYGYFTSHYWLFPLFNVHTIPGTTVLLLVLQHLSSMDFGHLDPCATGGAASPPCPEASSFDTDPAQLCCLAKASMAACYTVRTLMMHIRATYTGYLR